MGTLTTVLVVANVLNVALIGIFIFELGIFSYDYHRETFTLRLLVPLLGITLVAQTAVIGYIGYVASLGSRESRTFVFLYSTIRVWNIPASGIAYGIYALIMYMLMRRWVIPALIVLFACVQAVGDIVSTVGTLGVTPPTDLAPEGGMTMVGTMLSTIGASVCAFYVMTIMIALVRAQPVGTINPETGRCLVALQSLIIRIHTPGIVVSLIDLIACLLFPRSHVSTVMAIIVGKVWSIALLHGLNSRRGLRKIFRMGEPSTEALGPFVSHEIAFAARRADIALEEMRRPIGHTDTSSFGLEEDITSVRSIDEEERDDRGVHGHHDNYVRFGEPHNIQRGGERHERRSSAPL